MSGSPTSGQMPTVLVVDDEPAIRRYVGKILRLEGFETVEAADGVDACRAMDEFGTRISLVITDIKMPRMDGLALAEAVLQRCPGMPVIFMTGYASAAERPPREYEVLTKPFCRDILMKPVRQILETPRARPAGRT